MESDSAANDLSASYITARSQINSGSGISTLTPLGKIESKLKVENSFSHTCSNYAVPHQNQCATLTAPLTQSMILKAFHEDQLQLHATHRECTLASREKSGRPLSDSSDWHGADDIELCWSLIGVPLGAEAAFPLPKTRAITVLGPGCSLQ